MGRHKFPNAGAPLIAIPTTAGTGSEVTKVAVITDTAADVKMMMLDAHLVPSVALVDFELTLSMPAPLTAAVESTRSPTASKPMCRGRRMR